MSGWLAKLGIGLKKSSQKISGGINDIFGKRKIEAATLEELEELLITADMGVKASAKIVAAFGKKRFDKELEEKDIPARTCGGNRTDFEPMGKAAGY